MPASRPRAPIPHLRWYMAGLLCLASELNYLDRQTLSVLASTIQRELRITDIEYSKYLQQERGFTLAEIGAYAWIPFAALAIGNVAGGAIPRALVARGWPVDRARKRTMLIVSCAMPICYLALPQVASPAWALVLITIAMFGHAAWGNITLPAEVFPTRAIGTVTGLGGAFGGIAGVLTQLAIGRTVQAESFTPIFVTCAAIYLVAFVLVSWLCGELGRIIAIDDEPAGQR